MDLITHIHQTGFEMKEYARGYIASGEISGLRTPQHIQNQIVRLYCEVNDLEFILSRAEYWMNENVQSQLWASLKEGLNHIVFYSVLQMPKDEKSRQAIYRYCRTKNITLHFACERIIIGKTIDQIDDLEILLKSIYILDGQILT